MTRKQESSPQVLLDYLNLARGFLESKSIESARLEAELMLAEALGMSRLELYTNYERPLGDDEVSSYREMLKRRAAREPVHYITGRREFWSLDFRVDRRVLIPRPETELLVETAVECLSGGDLSEFPVADIGTGCGAIAVALAVEMPSLRIVATDASASSLEVAPANANRHGVAERITFVQGDLVEPAAAHGPFSMILSNPPYVKDEEFESLAPEVRRWEPKTALLGGPDGMQITRRLIDTAADCLCADGWLAIEVGTQAGSVEEYLKERGWRDVTIKPDLAGRARVVMGRPAART